MIMQEGRISSQQSLDVERQLESWLQQFDFWAATADRSEDGWESDFPQWQELMQATEKASITGHLSQHTLLMLGRCWALSEEDETCADWTREHLQEEHIREMVRRLTASLDPDTRWQAYDVLGDLLASSDKVRPVLEAGMADENPYVRRRAFLPLLHHLGNDATPYLLRMLADEDSYNRYIAVKEGRQQNISALQSQIDVAAHDPEVASHLDDYEANKQLRDQFDER
jgi:hypothetical protein